MKNYIQSKTKGNKFASSITQFFIYVKLERIRLVNKLNISVLIANFCGIANAIISLGITCCVDFVEKRDRERENERNILTHG